MNLGVTVPPVLLRRLKDTAEANNIDMNMLVVGMLTQASVNWGTRPARRGSGNEPTGQVFNRMYRKRNT